MANKLKSEKSLTDLDVAKKLVQLQQSATHRKLDFNLTFKTVKRLLSQQKCYYTGVTFKADGPLGRSIDRVDTNIGYVEGNVVACTVDINGKKANLANKEIEMLYKKLQKFYSKK
jgi:ribosome-interacting GTPase 1